MVQIKVCLMIPKSTTFKDNFFQKLNSKPQNDNGCLATTAWFLSNSILKVSNPYC